MIIVTVAIMVVAFALGLWIGYDPAWRAREVDLRAHLKTAVDRKVAAETECRALREDLVRYRDFSTAVLDAADKIR